MGTGGVSGKGQEQTHTSPNIGLDGTIYAAFGSALYALYNTNQLAHSAWPMYRANPRHTGRYEKPASYLKPPRKRADNNFNLPLYGQVGQSFSIQASSNLTTWTSITSIVANTFPIEIPDMAATNFPTRFYRAIQQ